MGSVTHTLSLLEILAATHEPITLADLARRTRRAKSTVHRQLHILMQAGFVATDADGKYSLTLKLWRLGVSVLSRLDVVSVARPHLIKLAKETNESSHLVILESPDTAVYVARVESRQPVGAKYNVGDRIPGFTSSSGRAIHAFRDETETEAHIRRHFKAQGAQVLSRMLRLVGETRQKGYSVARGEVYRERGGIAVPVRNFTGEVIGSCGIAVPTFRMTAELISRSLPAICAAGADISRALGFTSQSKV